MREGRGVPGRAAQAQGGWLCSQLRCDLAADGAGPARAAAAGGATAAAEPEGAGTGAGARWWAGGGNCLLARQGPLLVEYDAAMRAPIGVVFMGMGAGPGLAARLPRADLWGGAALRDTSSSSSAGDARRARRARRRGLRGRDAR